MPKRAMVIVGGGASTRFGSDKLRTMVAGRPLLRHAYESVAGHVDAVVVVAGHESLAYVREMRLDAVVTTGGETRTHSEWSGLQALDEKYDLIGIHDAARPMATAGLVERLFETAWETGGAAPLIASAGLVVARVGLEPLPSVRRAQTPQVFRGPELMAAYRLAIEEGFVGHDTAEVVQRFAGLTVVGVPGDVTNLKVTYPEDVDMVKAHLESRPRT